MTTTHRSGRTQAAVGHVAVRSIAGIISIGIAITAIHSEVRPG